MKNNKIMVLGNQFLTLFNEKIISYEQFTKIKKAMQKEQDKLYIHLGQGLSHLEIESICEKVKQSKHQMCLVGKNCRLKRAESYEALKGYIVSEPEKSDDQNYKSYLMLDNSFLEAKVHASTCSISTEIITKAALQLTEIISENFLSSNEASQKKTFLINQINTTPYEPIFPFEVELFFKIVTLREGLYGNFQAEADIEIVQNQIKIMTISINFSRLDKKGLQDIEKKMALSALEQQFISSPSRDLSDVAA